jgi:hypothetical protein
LSLSLTIGNTKSPIVRDFGCPSRRPISRRIGVSSVCEQYDRSGNPLSFRRRMHLSKISFGQLPIMPLWDIHSLELRAFLAKSPSQRRMRFSIG